MRRRLGSLTETACGAKNGVFAALMAPPCTGLVGLGASTAGGSREEAPQDPEDSARGASPLPRRLLQRATQPDRPAPSSAPVEQPNAPALLLARMAGCGSSHCPQDSQPRAHQAGIATPPAPHEGPLCCPSRREATRTAPSNPTPVEDCQICTTRQTTFARCLEAFQPYTTGTRHRCDLHPGAARCRNP